MNPNVNSLPTPELNTPVNPNRTPDNAFRPDKRLESPAARESAPLGTVRQPLAASSAQDARNLAVTGQQVPLGAPQAAAQSGITVQSEEETAIDKECISKAKAVIEQTSNDPYRQTKELGKVKAELIKRRYGKDLKVSEG